jgi:ATP-dependent DNA helicase RecQ
VQFIIGKEALYDFEKDHPSLQPLIHALLRNYEGIFDQPVSVRERQLAYSSRSEPRQLTRSWHSCRRSIIEYVPRRKSPRSSIFSGTA